MALPGVSDGGAHTKFITTARYATELLGHWVRERELMSLEEAHWRLSAYPALAVGLKDRGSLAEGKPADVIVYDPDTVDASPRSGCSTTRPASGGSFRRPPATTASSSTA